VASKWRAYFELLRFPAVFTAVADVMMGYLVTHCELRPWYIFALLVATSGLLYLAGMALNDAFDAEIDARDRPARPIPSGRISSPSAAKLGLYLLASGICAAWFASFASGNWLPGIVGSLLAGCVVLYDGVVKKTIAAPFAMGGCRFLNVLLGMSLAAAPRWPFQPSWNPTELAIALGIGIFIAGLTWFARGEARSQSRTRLLGGIFVMALGFLVLEMSGQVKLSPAHLFTESASWPLLWLGIGAIVVGRCLWAAWRFEPRAIQIAVRNSLRAVIVIDAAIVLGFCGPYWGCVVLALLAPMLLLERWASTT
jgi:4-hydroxybenzoate polyprenyltransferase